MILETLDSLSDLKALSVERLADLANEIRETLITRLSSTGGHVGSNLGVVELTVSANLYTASPADLSAPIRQRLGG